MHTFHPSRGRILFEVLCALGIAASFAGGWIQTGAWALVPAAVIAALYSLVRAFDLARRSPAFVTADGELDLNPADHGYLPADHGRGVPLAALEQPESVEAMEIVELVEPEASPPPRKATKAKTPRKPKARKASEDKMVTEPVQPQEEVATSAGAREEEGVDLAEFSDEMAHIPLTPLFEPEPFVRQQRTVFGRKAG